MKKALFIDRDGTIIKEPPVDFQVDSLEKLEFVPGAIGALGRIAGLGFEFVMATNQDGLGTESFPEDTFWPAQNRMLSTLGGEGVRFDDILIDRSLPADNAPTRKPRTGMFGKYTGGDYDLAASFVIGDRITDIELAANLGARGILLQPAEKGREMLSASGLAEHCVLVTDDWNRIWVFLRSGERTAHVRRKTSETDIDLFLDLDGGGGGAGEIVGTGRHVCGGAEAAVAAGGAVGVAAFGRETESAGAGRAADNAGTAGSVARAGTCEETDAGKGTPGIDTGLKFFDHMLDQIVHHAGVTMRLKVEGDLYVDEHHTIEDVGIALGEAVYHALGSKLGIERYGFALPMDESRAMVLIDFGGRINFEWKAEFRREMVGDVPTEMFRHFFKSFCEAAKCNLYIEAEGGNEHHKIEGIFKAFSRALRMAASRNNFKFDLPSSKGVL